MLANKKIFIAIITVLLIGIIAILGSYICNKNKYSLENVQAMLNQNKDISNIHIVEKYESQKEPNSQTTAMVDTYIKDNQYYIVQKNVVGQIILESFGNIQENNQITVTHFDSKIISSKIEKFEEIDNSNFMIVSKNATAKYKYIGKTKVDGKQCIKVCITNEYNDKAEKDYYYINLEDNHIIKSESYTGDNLKELKKEGEVTYTYLYNTVQDKDILRFDINNYVGYEYNK